MYTFTLDQAITSYFWILWSLWVSWSSSVLAAVTCVFLCSNWSSTSSRLFWASSTANSTFCSSCNKIQTCNTQNNVYYLMCWFSIKKRSWQNSFIHFIFSITCQVYLSFTYQSYYSVTFFCTATIPFSSFMAFSILFSCFFCCSICSCSYSSCALSRARWLWNSSLKQGIYTMLRAEQLTKLIRDFVT